MAAQFVIVKLELGHKASYRTHVSPKGFTHDWSIYVRGADGADIQHFVDKVVFRLHETFERPVQVRREPPYAISESGYASFELRVDIHFKNDEEPNMISYVYDLYLPAEGSPPVKHYRQEKLTFKNPPDEFRKRLIQGGGIATDNPSSLSNAPTQSTSMTGSSGDAAKPSGKTGKGSGSTPGKELRGVTAAADSDSRTSSSSKGDSVGGGGGQQKATADKKQQGAAVKGGSGGSTVSTEESYKPSEKRHPSDTKAADKGSEKKDSSSKSSKKSGKDGERSLGSSGGGSSSKAEAAGSTSSDKERQQPVAALAAAPTQASAADKAKDKEKVKDGGGSKPSKASSKDGGGSSKQPKESVAEKTAAMPASGEKSRDDGRSGSSSKSAPPLPATAEPPPQTDGKLKDSSSSERSRSSAASADRLLRDSDKVRDASADRPKSSTADKHKDAVGGSSSNDKGKASAPDRSKSDVGVKDVPALRPDKAAPPSGDKLRQTAGTAAVQLPPPVGSSGDYGSAAGSKSSSSGGGSGSSRTSKTAPSSASDSKPRRGSEDRKPDRSAPSVDKGTEGKKQKTENAGGSSKTGSAPVAPTAAQLGLWDSSSSDASDRAPSPAAAVVTTPAASRQAQQPQPVSSAKSGSSTKPGAAARTGDIDKPKPDAGAPSSKSRSPVKAAVVAAPAENDDRSRKAPGKAQPPTAVSESPNHRPATKRTSVSRATDDDDDDDDGSNSGEIRGTVLEPPAKIRHFSGDGAHDRSRGLTPSRKLLPGNAAAAAPLGAAFADVPEVPAAASLASAAAAAALANRSHQRAPNGVLVGELLGLHEKIRLLTDRLVIQRVVDIIEDTGLYKITEKSFDFDLCVLDSGTIKKLEQCLQ